MLYKLSIYHLMCLSTPVETSWLTFNTLSNNLLPEVKWRKWTNGMCFIVLYEAIFGTNLSVEHNQVWEGWHSRIIDNQFILLLYFREKGKMYLALWGFNEQKVLMEYYLTVLIYFCIGLVIFWYQLMIRASSLNKMHWLLDFLLSSDQYLSLWDSVM